MQHSTKVVVEREGRGGAGSARKEQSRGEAQAAEGTTRLQQGGVSLPPNCTHGSESSSGITLTFKEVRDQFSALEKVRCQNLRTATMTRG